MYVVTPKTKHNSKELHKTIQTYHHILVSRGELFATSFSCVTSFLWVVSNWPATGQQLFEQTTQQSCKLLTTCSHLVDSNKVAKPFDHLSDQDRFRTSRELYTYIYIINLRCDFYYCYNFILAQMTF